MPGRFLNLQPVASWGGSEKGETPKPRDPQETNPPREPRPSLRDSQNQSAFPSLWLLGVGCVQEYMAMTEGLGA